MIDTSGNILVVTEQEGGSITPLSLEMLGIARRLSDQSSGNLCACVIGSGIADLADDYAAYADAIYVADDPRLSGLHPDLYAHTVHALCSSIRPLAVIMGHTYENVEMGPKLACRIDSEFIPDCMEVRRDEEGRLLCTRQVYGGNAIAVFELPRRGIITVRPKTFEAATPGGLRAEIIPFAVDMESVVPLSDTLSVVEEESVNMGSAQVIVSGGRGVASPERIAELENIVVLLKRRFERVELGASRPLVDAGLVPRSRQVGQTGERVAPGVYFALGISGATQHLSGMSGSKKVVAINKSEEAPIFKVSDYGVVGLLEEVVPGFIRRLEELL
jgi:electron transfer flavoprotein alpha subunit